MHFVTVHVRFDSIAAACSRGFVHKVPSFALTSKVQAALSLGVVVNGRIRRGIGRDAVENEPPLIFQS